MALDRTRVVSGAFSSVWNELDVGNVALGGYKLRYSYLQKEINFDAVGLTPVDALFTGLIMLIDFVCMQYSSEAISEMAWFMGDSTAGRGRVKAAGFSLWDAAKPFIMTSCSMTNNPTAMTFHKTILAPNFEVVQDHSGVTEKVVPMRLIVFPVAYNGDNDYTPPLRPVACTDTVYFTETVGDM
jgi:hypothetical protein